VAQRGALAASRKLKGEFIASDALDGRRSVEPETGMKLPGEMLASSSRCVRAVNIAPKGYVSCEVLRHHGILGGPMGRTGKEVRVFTGHSGCPILATNGGTVEHLVKLNDRVEAGQKLAIQRNKFWRE